MSLETVSAAATLLVFAAAVLWLPRWLAFRTTQRSLDQILKERKPADPRILEDARYGTITADETGFQISHKDGASPRVPWTDISEIHAFKRDILTVDLICVVLRMKSDGMFYEVNEEMAGYHDLQLAMERYLPEYDRLSWYATVAFPAFETNYQVVWTCYLKNTAAPA